MIKFYLPGLFEFFDLYVIFMDIFQHEKFKFRDCEIGAIYGAPQNTIWNGGRIRCATYTDINNVKNWSIDENINCALTFTNCLIEENHLDNIYCNELARLFETENNSIIIHSPILENYLREEYPKYNFISSTTKCITDFEDLKEELKKDYKRVVLDYNFNRKFNLLKQIEQKEKCEILINAVCEAECPRRKEHYNYISKEALHIPNENDFICKHMSKPFFAALKEHNSISVDEIYNLYAPLGFEHFKIEGRTTHYQDLIEILVYYTVKPEFQMEIRQRLNMLF